MIDMSKGYPELGVSQQTGELLARLRPIVAVSALDADQHLADIDAARDELRRMDTLGIFDPSTWMRTHDLVAAWSEFLTAYRKMTVAAVALQQVARKGTLQ